MNIFYGVVEDRINDPLKLGRVRVRISGIHTENKHDLPTADLPWAMVMQPTNSAANSGIGYSPTGILEGTWVMLVFRDEDQQSPIIIGTLPGIPSIETTTSNPENRNAVISSDGTSWTDSSGAPVKTGGSGVEQSSISVDNGPSDLVVKKPSAFVTSGAGFAFLKSLEGLASTSRDKKRIGNDSTSPDALIYPYLDTEGIYTIGWGNTIFANGTRVDKDSVIRKVQADELFLSSIRSDYEKSARRLIKVPLTQSMFDACVSMIYNMGASGFARTEILPALNAGNYAAAAAFIPISRNNGGTLTGRRTKEKNLFLAEGIPNTDGSVEKVLADKEAAREIPPDITKNPVVLAPVVIPPVNTSIGSNPSQLSEPGFSDPNKKYPLFTGEPDTNRLARHEKIDGTIVVMKEAARVTGVPMANGDTWDQPKIPYNALYPHNNVYSTASGHIQEFDDTKDNERIHLYHKAGTYTEIDANGTTVNRIVGDSYSIIERNGHILIRGACSITVEGDANIRVENNTTLESLGDLDIKVGGNINMGAGGTIRMSSSGDISLDGGDIHLNSGMGGSVKRASGTALGAPALSTLSIPNRNDYIDYMYETPEDGDNTAFIAEQVSRGNIDPDEVKPEVVRVAEEEPVAKVAQTPATANCDAIMAETKFTMAYRLTENFTLGDVIKGDKAEIPVGTNFGLSPQEIVCNLKQLTINVIDPIKRVYPNLIITNSWRSEKRNKEVGGVPTSDHLKGYAVDIKFGGFNRTQTYEACVAIQKLLPAYHKIILEYRGKSMWIHIAYKPVGNAGVILTMNNDRTYKSGSFVLLG